MPDNNKLNVVLYWHMHQPDYRTANDNIYKQPWTYLHTIKDYIDMAMHIEAEPSARAVFNFTPILLDQIEDYANQVKAYLQNKSPIKDPLLAALANHNHCTSVVDRIALLDWCMRAHEDRIIQRYPPYHQLVNIYNQVRGSSHAHIYLTDQYVTDLLVWYHIGWLGELVKKQDLRVKLLIKKKHAFDLQDRLELLSIIGDILSSVIPKYKALAESGKIELTTSPYAHPIIPLLVDFSSALESMPHAPLPKYKKYPGGEQRARWHIEKSIDTFVHHFRFVPTGCWPSEGGVSTATLELLDEAGFKWTASGTNVFKNSVDKSLQSTQQKLELYDHQPNKLSGQNTLCFFRDDELSDLIGFEYSSWHADDAVANMIHRLVEIAKNPNVRPDSIISIILDGENAWEHYPKNGYYFLSALYRALSNHPSINLTTYTEYLSNADVTAQELPCLVAGSWVYGTLSTWIGSKDKNLGWEMLCEAKMHYDKTINSGTLSREEISQATNQLGVCEGSDWFWWFGDYNPAISVSSFEKLYRENLIYLYQILHIDPPPYLYTSFTSGSIATTDEGTMRRGSKSV